MSKKRKSIEFGLPKPKKTKVVSNKDDVRIVSCSFGCIIGASIGDILGSVVEGTKSSINDKEMKKIMKMKGNGVHKLAVGQATDDTEMSIALTYGLLKMIDPIKYQNSSRNSLLKDIDDNNFDEKKDAVGHNIKLDWKYVVYEYARWWHSNPFDFGTCTEATISQAPDINKMIATAKKINEEAILKYGGFGNLANGACMRISPLIVFGLNLNYDNLYTILRQDAILTHNNPIIVISNMVYALSIIYLIKHNYEKDRAIKAIDVSINWLNGFENDDNKPYCVEIRKWIMNVIQKKQLQPSFDKMGFVKIAIQRSFHHLFIESAFEDALYSGIVFDFLFILKYMYICIYIYIYNIFV